MQRLRLYANKLIFSPKIGCLMPPRNLCNNEQPFAISNLYLSLAGIINDLLLDGDGKNYSDYLLWKLTALGIMGGQNKALSVPH